MRCAVLDFKCQVKALESLTQYAYDRRHSIIIEGCSGCGKTELAKSYASMLGIADVLTVEPKVNDIKDAFYGIASIDNDIVVIIDNLDSGVSACSYALLKAMEEPSDNLYIVVTCSDVRKIPDTVKSRCVTATIASPSSSDLDRYAEKYYESSFKAIRRKSLWRCARSFADVDLLCNMKDDEISYVSKWSNLNRFTSSVNNIGWKLGHYDNGSEAPYSLIVRYVMYSNKEDMHCVRSCINCLNDLDSKRIAPYMALLRLAFELKYCE